MHNAVARMFCSDPHALTARTFEGDPAARAGAHGGEGGADGLCLQRGSRAGVLSTSRTREGTEVLDRGGYFDLTSLDYASDLRRDTVLTLEKMGIPVEYSHHENGPSQHEIDLRFTDALSMADAVMTYKLVVKEIALKHGVHASFMPKPMADAAGSGMHVHQSLFDLDGNNAFFDAERPSGLQPFEGGEALHRRPFEVRTRILRDHQPVRELLQAPGDGRRGPHIHLVGARATARTLVRIPATSRDKEEACRVELRSPDPAANPYLAFAVMLAAGLKGIEDELRAAASHRRSRPVQSVAPRAARAGHCARCPIALAKPWSCSRPPISCARCSASTSMPTWSKRSAQNGTTTKRFVTQWERDRYLGALLGGSGMQRKQRHIRGRQP